MFIAAISATFSLLSPRLERMFGLKALWVLSLCVYSAVMMVSPFVSDLNTALIVFSFIGLPMGASFTVPWAVVSSYCAKKDRANAGLWLSSLNIAECGPELSVGLLGGLIVDRFWGDVSSVFFLAGVVNLVSVLLVVRVDLSITRDMSAKYETVGDVEEEDGRDLFGRAGAVDEDDTTDTEWE